MNTDGQLIIVICCYQNPLNPTGHWMHPQTNQKLARRYRIQMCLTAWPNSITTLNNYSLIVRFKYWRATSSYIAFIVFHQWPEKVYPILHWLHKVITVPIYYQFSGQFYGFSLWFASQMRWLGAADHLLRSSYDLEDQWTTIIRSETTNISRWTIPSQGLPNSKTSGSASKVNTGLTMQ